MAKKKKTSKRKLAKKKVVLHKVKRKIPKEKELLMPPVQVKPEQLSGNYTNVAVISHTEREFVLDFLLVIANQHSFASRVITSPQHAKQISQVLDKNIKDYEKKFGEIKLK